MGAPKVNLIGLSGWAQSGKDSTGKVLVEKFGYVRFAFADALKDTLYDLDPIVKHKDATWARYGVRYYVDREDWEWTKANTNAREYLQRLGVAVREHVDQDAWVNAVLKDVLPGERVVITDVRFPNEALAIWNAGGELWRVERAGHLPPNDHISEHALDDFAFDRVLSLPNYHDDLEALNTELVAQVGAGLS